jgi:hypothetical protein
LLLVRHFRVSEREEIFVPVFTDENIAKLFGAEAAEDETEERFRQYFFIAGLMTI